MCELIDVHAHLQDSQYSEDLEDVMERAAQAGVRHVINAGTDIQTSLAAVNIASKAKNYCAAVGFHPHDSANFQEQHLLQLEKMAANPAVVAIGEIGLDYHYDHSPRDVQKKVFISLWRLAVRLNLPAVVHIREAFDDFFALIESEPIPKNVLLHCFSGDIHIAKAALEKGFHFSIGGALTFPKSTLTREVFSFLPSDRMHIETDCPYLSPQPFRGKRNEPARLVHTFDCLCSLRNVDRNLFADILRENAEKFFSLKTGVGKLKDS